MNFTENQISLLCDALISAIANEVDAERHTTSATAKAEISKQIDRYNELLQIITLERR